MFYTEIGRHGFGRFHVGGISGHRISQNMEVENQNRQPIISKVCSRLAPARGINNEDLRHMNMAFIVNEARKAKEITDYEQETFFIRNEIPMKYMIR